MLNEDEIKGLRQKALGTHPPLNLGRDDMVLFMRTDSKDYFIYYPKEDRFEKFNEQSVRVFLRTMGFDKKVFENLPIQLFKEVREPAKPRWVYVNNIWHYNLIIPCRHRLVYQYLSAHALAKGLNQDRKGLVLPPLHNALFENVGGCNAGVEYLANKFKHLLLGTKRSNTYTILRGIGGTGKSLIIQYLSVLVGSDESVVIEHGDLKDYNAIIKNACVVLVEELPYETKEVNRFLTGLKGVVGNETLAIREKYVNIYNVKNHTNFFMTTNSTDLFSPMYERRHCEVLSKKKKLNTYAVFKELDNKGLDYLEALLLETPLFFKALVEWNNKDLGFNDKFISQGIDLYYNVSKEFNGVVEQILNNNFTGFIAQCKNDKELSLAMYYDRKKEKFQIPIGVVEETFLSKYKEDLIKKDIIIDIE